MSHLHTKFQNYNTHALQFGHHLEVDIKEEVMRNFRMDLNQVSSTWNHLHYLFEFADFFIL